MAKASSSVHSRPPKAVSDPVLEMRGVTKVFAGGGAKVAALKDVDLVFRKGELIVVREPSGSGKTTLLNLIGGLDRPTSGSIAYNGVQIAKLSDGGLGEFRREHIGFVFQFFNLIPTLTARENVEFAAELVIQDRRSVAGAIRPGSHQQVVHMEQAPTEQPCWSSAAPAG